MQLGIKLLSQVYEFMAHGDESKSVFVPDNLTSTGVRGEYYSYISSSYHRPWCWMRNMSLWSKLCGHVIAV